MTFVSSLLFAVSASLDALMVGITYGIRKIRLSFLQNLLVSLITLFGTVIAICLGNLLAPFFSGKPLVGAGSAILIGMGVYYLIKYLVPQVQKYRAGPDTDNTPVSENDSSASDAGCSESVSLTTKKLLLLGLALSANNMGIGIGASMAGIPLMAASVFTFLCSVCFLKLGNSLGQLKFLQLADRFADPLSGLLLILLGICQLL